MKFKFLTGDVNWKQYGGKFISKCLNNGDWNYYLIIDVTNMWDATGDEEQAQYNVSIQAVSPEAAGQENINKALGSFGMSDEQLRQYENDPITQAEALITYGIFAQLWTRDGGNIETLMQEARKEAQLIESLFGFYMDRPENGIGQTGWELIRGQDIKEFFNK